MHATTPHRETTGPEHRADTDAGAAAGVPDQRLAGRAALGSEPR
jgi:hypothetical protein